MTILLVTLVSAWPLIWLLGLTGWRQLPVLLLMLVWAAVPVAWSSVALLAAFGIQAPSLVAAGMVIMLMLARAGRAPSLPVDEARLIAMGVMLAGALWYGSALLPALPDLHGLGWGSFQFSTGLLLVGLASWVIRAYHACLLLVIAQAGFALELLPAANLWYYLVDPLLLMVAPLWLLASVWPAQSSTKTGSA